MGRRPYILEEVRQCTKRAKLPYSLKPPGGYACNLCPIRSFDLKDRLRKHLEISRCAMVSGVASPRVLRLALALYNIDQMHVSGGLVLSLAAGSGSFLGRASREIAEWVIASNNPNHRVMTGKVAQIDRRIMLVFTWRGPIHAVRGNEGSNAYRRVGNVRYDEDFASILLSYAIRPNVNWGGARSIREPLLEHFISTQCGEEFLLPSRQPAYMNVMEDIIADATARFIRGRCLARLRERGIRNSTHDRTYEMLMSVKKTSEARRGNPRI